MKLMEVPRAIRREPVGTVQSRVAVTLPTRSGSFDLTEADIASQSHAFPRVDVVGELRKMRAWLDANPSNRKTHRGMPRFVTGWLMRAAGRVGQGRAGGEAPSAPRVVGLNGDGSVRFG